MWFLIEVVDQLDLAEFRRVYCADGHGRAAYDPVVMIAMLLYAYCGGVALEPALAYGRRARSVVVAHVMNLGGWGFGVMTRGQST